MTGFLGGGATQKYNANPFKPMAAPSPTEKPGKFPIYYIHRCVPHDTSHKPRCRLVLTKDLYEKAYAPGAFTVTTDAYPKVRQGCNLIAAHKD